MINRSTLCSLTLLTATLLLLSAPAQGGDRALLVGIDHYRDPQVPETPGATMDARALASLARERFGFPANGIKVLLNEEATAESIVREIRHWLIEGTEPGDRVFFSYAGHGSQLEDDNGDEVDGYDETLAPYGVDPLRGTGQIRDDVLDPLIAQLTGRRAVLLFDSCHSGTVTRGKQRNIQHPRGGGVRFLPRPEDFRTLHEKGELSRSGDLSYMIQGSAGDSPKVFDEPDALGQLSGIVTISAAGPQQLAYPVESGGQYRGALSLLFEEIYGGSRSARGFFKFLKKVVVGSLRELLLDDLAQQPKMTYQGLKVGNLENTLQAAMQQLQSSGHIAGSQVPQIDVLSQIPLGNDPLFGDWGSIAPVALNHPASPYRVTLRTSGNQTRYRSGENIVFDVSVNRPGYLYLVVFSAERTATCIFPSQNDSSNSIASGSVRIPTHPSYVFPVQAPFGRDVVMALVSERPMNLCERVYYSWDEIYQRVDLRSVHENFRERSMRGVGVQPTGSPGSGPPTLTISSASWQSATLILETSP